MTTENQSTQASENSRVLLHLYIFTEADVLTSLCQFRELERKPVFICILVCVMFGKKMYLGDVVF